jgi:hypothetical protein
LVVAATNLSTTLDDSANIPDTATQDKVDYETKRLNAAIDGYNAAMPIQADFSALKVAQARAQALLEQVPSALGAAWVPPRSAPAPGSIVINGYDLSTYATDPLYGQKIQDIVTALPAFSTADSIDNYIQTFAAGSPVTGAMVLASATQYNVDVPLLVAVMQNDSQFGTLGVGATTNNPGNVGNTGSSTQSYASWEDGVSAVAAWLNNHRAALAPVPVEPPPVVDTVPVVPVPDLPPVVPVEPEAPVTTVPTSTPATATSTPPVFVPDATSTPPVATTTPDAATTTPDISAPDLGTGSSTPDSASTTPDTASSTTP